MLDTRISTDLNNDEITAFIIECGKRKVDYKQIVGNMIREATSTFKFIRETTSRTKKDFN